MYSSPLKAHLEHRGELLQNSIGLINFNSSNKISKIPRSIDAAQLTSTITSFPLSTGCRSLKSFRFSIRITSGNSFIVEMLGQLHKG